MRRSDASRRSKHNRKAFCGCPLSGQPREGFCLSGVVRKIFLIFKANFVEIAK